MNVGCPQCSSIFRVDPARVPSGGVRARCSICGGVMIVPEPTSADRSEVTQAAAYQTPPAAPRYAGTTPPPGPAFTESGEMPPAMGLRQPEPTPPAPAPMPRIPLTTPVDYPSMLPTTPPAPFAPPEFAQPPAPRAPTPPPMAQPVGAQITPPPMAQPVSASITPPGVPESMAAPPEPAQSRPVTSEFSTSSATGEHSVSTTGSHVNPYLTRDPHARARRLSRALVSDIVAYYRDKHEEALKSGDVKEQFRDEIKKSYEDYVAQVGAELAQSTTYFQDALNEVLARGQRIF